MRLTILVWFLKRALSTWALRYDGKDFHHPISTPSVEYKRDIRSLENFRNTDERRWNANVPKNKGEAQFREWVRRMDQVEYFDSMIKYDRDEEVRDALNMPHYFLRFSECFPTSLTPSLQQVYIFLLKVETLIFIDFLGKCSSLKALNELFLLVFYKILLISWETKRLSVEIPCLPRRYVITITIIKSLFICYIILDNVTQYMILSLLNLYIYPSFVLALE